MVQKTKAGEVNWIIETRGHVWEGTAAKEGALETWCERVSEARGGVWSVDAGAGLTRCAGFDLTRVRPMNALVSR